MRKGERTVRYTRQEVDKMLRRGEDRTDFARLDATTEEELESSIDHEKEREIDRSTLQVGLPLLKTGRTSLLCFSVSCDSVGSIGN